MTEYRRHSSNGGLQVFFLTCFIAVFVLDTPPSFSQAPTPNADFNSDGRVDFLDLTILQEHWQKRAPTPVPPETIVIDLPGLPEGAKPLEMVRIPEGTFEMGSADDISWSWCYPCEQPVHTVNIGYDFYMGKYEVTQAQWTALMGSNPSYFSGADKPMELVSWNDCQDFIAALNNLGQGTFRLPSEAEWEYACRGGTTTRFYFGDSNCSPASSSPCDLGNYAWYYRNDSPSGNKEVGQRIPNAFGLHDMHGNVWEWCQDYWHGNYQGAPADGSTWESPTSSYRVIRGGFWSSSPQYCRSSSRTRTLPTSTTNIYGFRVVRAQ